MTQDPVYEEHVSSARTQVLYAILTTIFLLWGVGRLAAGHPDMPAFAFLFLSVIFAFYASNYRTLVIRITPRSLRLVFGIFAWTIALDRIETCRIDDPPPLAKYGGAGIHFLVVRRRYRASFNFLEHPRVVIALRPRAGLVRDISFSTRQPEEVIRRLQPAAPTGRAA